MRQAYVATAKRKLGTAETIVTIFKMISPLLSEHFEQTSAFAVRGTLQ